MRWGPESSRTLSYNFVELGASGSFTGATRDQSEEPFVDYLKKGDILGQVLRYQAMHSPSSAQHDRPIQDGQVQER